jgi:hypothetical protein
MNQNPKVSEMSDDALCAELREWITRARNGHYNRPRAQEVCNELERRGYLKIGRRPLVKQ